MTAVFPIAGSLTSEVIPALCQQLTSLMKCTSAKVIVCDLAELESFNLATIDALAQLQLTARRHGREIQLRHLPQRLKALIKLCGLEQTLKEAGTHDGRSPTTPGTGHDHASDPCGS
jgi:anti-anti-sigma regulatory factor